MKTLIFSIACLVLFVSGCKKEGAQNQQVDASPYSFGGLRFKVKSDQTISIDFKNDKASGTLVIEIFDKDGTYVSAQEYNKKDDLKFTAGQTLLMWGFITVDGKKELLYYSGMPTENKFFIASDAEGKSAPNIIIMTQDVEQAIATEKKAKITLLAPPRNYPSMDQQGYLRFTVYKNYGYINPTMFRNAIGSGTTLVIDVYDSNGLYLREAKTWTPNVNIVFSKGEKLLLHGEFVRTGNDGPEIVTLGYADTVKNHTNFYFFDNANRTGTDAPSIIIMTQDVAPALILRSKK